MDDSFPRQQARTRRFTLGAPRDFTVARDGSRVAFLRSPAGDDPQTGLWVVDVASGTERLVADPNVLLGPTGDAGLSPEERARRERSREMAGGITTYAADADLRRASFALSGRLWWADLIDGVMDDVAVPGPVFDPRPDPSGRLIAYCSGGALWIVNGNGPHSPRPLADDDTPDVTWGLAEFIAAEEMGRSRGYWWSPDGSAILATRVDNGPVGTWWISDPSRPGQPSVPHRYPAAGTADADVRLYHLTVDGPKTEVIWDRVRFPYLVVVTWTSAGPPLLLVESRDHQRTRVLSVEVTSGVTTVLSEDSDQGWVERPPGLPAWLSGGRLVWATDSDDTRRLLVDGRAVTPPGLQVRVVIDVSSGLDAGAALDAGAGVGVGVADTITFTASTDPTEV